MAGVHLEQTMVDGETSLGMGSNVSKGDSVGLGQDGGSGVQHMEADTPLLLGGLFPINSNPYFSLGRTELVDGVRKSKRLSSKV
ncbi:hypothetical protein EV1_045270 [Malus domestica]